MPHILVSTQVRLVSIQITIRDTVVSHLQSIKNMLGYFKCNHSFKMNVYRMGPPPPSPPTRPNPTHPRRKIGALMPDISWAPPHSLPIQ